MYTDEEKILFGVAATAAVVFTALEYRKIRKQGQLERKLIRLEAIKDMHAIDQASEKVLQDIRNGEYDRRGFNDVITDLRFYRIASRFND